jgi:thiosulfate dehydrogenase
MGFGRQTAAIAIAGCVVALAIGIGLGYAVWGPKDWYAFRDPQALPSNPANDLIRTGHSIIISTATEIGPLAADPANRFAGNKLNCTNCHLNGGLQKFGAPLVSTFATYPLLVNDTVESLADRINGCMMRSMNGKPLPETGDAMNALIAYIRFLGDGTPESVRVEGMGLKALPEPAETADKTRGASVYASSCARCHGANGQGEALATGAGFAIPPLWGDDSFNGAAGMADLRMAAAFIHANMPRGVTYEDPLLTVQQAWDVAAYVTSQPRPPAPAADSAP